MFVLHPQPGQAVAVVITQPGLPALAHGPVTPDRAHEMLDVLADQIDAGLEPASTRARIVKLVQA